MIPCWPRWPVLYPEIMGASEPDDERARETVRVRYEVIAPLLEATDIHSAFEVMSEELQEVEILVADQRKGTWKLCWTTRRRRPTP